MKKIFLFLALFTYSFNYSQVFTTENKEAYNKFKTTETIFVISDFYDAKVYEDILKNSWTVTPFKVVKRASFNPMEYMNEKFSFAYLDQGQYSHKPQQSSFTNTFIYSQISFFYFNMKDKKKELEKLTKKSENKKTDYNIMTENRVTIGTVVLYPMEKLSQTLYISSTIDEAEKLINTEESFFNLKPGYLKNYFQKLNNIIVSGEHLTNGNSCTPELKALKKQTLLVPSYISLKYKRTTMENEERDEEEQEELFKDYTYKYQIVDDNEINERILLGEEFYYLRYVKLNNLMYVDVVNSKTGEVVYKNLHKDFTHQLKGRHIKEIITAIEKGKVKK